MAEENVYVGIDVSKAWLDIAVEPGEELWRTENSELGIAKLVKRLAVLRAELHRGRSHRWIRSQVGEKLV